MAAPLAAGQLLAAPTTNHAVLGLAAVLGIGAVVALITAAKVHPFLALILGSGVLGIVAGLGVEKTVDSFTDGVGSTVGSVGLLIALGAMIGKLLADSSGADRIVGTVVDRVHGAALPWAMAGVAALIGIPLFFEVGVVLLVPIVLLAARKADVPVLRVGIPALAGLSVLHGLVPPHPGPLVAIAALKADLGLTLLFGIICAVPAVILAGPVFARFIEPRIHVAHPVPEPDTAAGSGPPAEPGTGGGGTATATDVRAAPSATSTRRPAFGGAVVVVLTPVVLMLARAIGELTLDDGNRVRSVLDTIGEPVIALLAGVLLAALVLGAGTGMSRGQISDSLGSGLPPIAGVLLIVAAGGGFKQTLVDAGVGNLVAGWAKGAHLNALLLGWLVAVGIRLATGSATVATITAAGIVAPLAAGLDRPTVALLALAVGAGSLFFSHVNDAGFWLVKEYFGMTVGQTLATWSVMETIISVVGLVGVLLLNLVV
jgi:GntP family gluconate:H+ symporter